ncbi:hypothetical protein ACFLYQ_01320 [Chloroflexota bacterium]
MDGRGRRPASYNVPIAPADMILKALPRRTWKSITIRACHLKLSRRKGSNAWKTWSNEDDGQLKLYCERGMDIQEMAERLKRSPAVIKQRIEVKGLERPESHKRRGLAWEVYDLIPSQQSPS